MSPKVMPNFDQEAPQMRAGEHVCIILDSTLKYAKESENPYINWKLRTEDDGRIFYYITPTTGRGAGMFKYFVHRAGDPDYQSGEYETEQLHGNKVFCELSIDRSYYKVVRVLDFVQEAQQGKDLPF